MQRNDFTRRLSEGIAAKLEFDYVCERGNSFSEYYLHGAINEIIGALVAPADHRIHAGFAHPVLKRTPGSGSGRQKEVDFQVQPYVLGGGALTVEAKWADSSHASWDRILLDLCRLTLIAQTDEDAECLFVLAGSSMKVEEVFQSILEHLPERKGKGRSRGLVEIPGENDLPYQRKYQLRDWAGRFAGNNFVLEGLPKDYKGQPDIPFAIRSTLVKSTLAPSAKWQAVVWRVTAV